MVFGSGFFGKKKPSEESARPLRLSPSISNSVLSLAGARGIPPMPAAAQKAFQLSIDPSAEARDFIEIIEADEALSARVLKIANSVYFERGKKSETIEESVLVIGVNELRNLLSATTLTDIFPSLQPARNQLWANDIATAISAKIVARRACPEKSESAFLGGLMHDIGKLLMLQRAAEDYGKVLIKVQEQGCDFCTAEEEIFVFNHAEAGQMIGEKWNFTPELISVIRYHHRPWAPQSMDGPKNGLSLVEVVKAADLISHSLGLGHPRGYSRVEKAAQESLEEVWLRLNLPEDARRSLLQEVQRAFNLEYDLYSGKAGR
jgi:HD-like signal output (HDOD) protein